MADRVLAAVLTGAGQDGEALLDQIRPALSETTNKSITTDDARIDWGRLPWMRISDSEDGPVLDVLDAPGLAILREGRTVRIVATCPKPPDTLLNAADGMPVNRILHHALLSAVDIPADAVSWHDGGLEIAFRD